MQEERRYKVGTPGVPGVSQNLALLWAAWWRVEAPQKIRTGNFETEVSSFECHLMVRYYLYYVIFYGTVGSEEQD